MVVSEGDSHFGHPNIKRLHIVSASSLPRIFEQTSTAHLHQAHPYLRSSAPHRALAHPRQCACCPPYLPDTGRMVPAAAFCRVEKHLKILSTLIKGFGRSWFLPSKTIKVPEKLQPPLTTTRAISGLNESEEKIVSTLASAADSCQERRCYQDFGTDPDG